MGQERESLRHQEEIVMIYSARARAINTQFQLGQKLGLRGEKEKEIFNLYLAERLLENEVHLAIAGQNNSRFFQETEPLVEGISLAEEKIEKLKELVNPKRAWIISAAINNLNTRAKNKNPENANASLFQPTEEVLTLWKNKWAPQLT